MLSIKVNGLFLDLGDAEFTFTLENPAFQDAGIAKTYSFPVTIKATPTNNVIFNHAYRTDTTEIVKKHPAVCYLLGTQFAEGYVKIINNTAKEYHLNFEDIGTDFIRDLKRTNIRDLMPVVQVASALASVHLELNNFSNNTFVGSRDLGVHINGVLYRYFVSPGEDINDALNGLADLINADYPDSTVVIHSVGLEITQPNDSESFGIVVPAGFQYDFTVTASNYQSQIHAIDFANHLTNNQTTPLNQISHGFPRIRNTKLYKNNKAFNFIINNDTHQLNTDAGQWTSTYAPYASLHYLLRKIFEGFDLDGDYINNVLPHLLIYHPNTIDMEIEDIIQLDYFNVFRPRFDLNDYLPDLKAYELLEQLHTTFLIYCQPIDGTFQFKYARDQVNGSVEDWTSKAQPAYKSETPLLEGYTIKHQEDSTDKAPTYPKITVGEGKNQRELIATVYGSGIVQQEQDDKPPMLKLMHYTPLPFPLARYYATPAETHAQNESFLDLLNTGKPLKTILTLTTSDLINIARFENPVKRINFGEGTVQGLVQKVSFKASAKGISKSTVHMLCKTAV